MDIQIREAVDEDRKGIISLLMDNMLPTGDLNKSPVTFFVAALENRILGTIGLERYDKIGLLRSLAVADDFKNQGIGARLVEFLFQYCTREGISDLYLMTTTAYQYFPRYGFTTINRDTIPNSIRQTSEFSSLCSTEAVVMHSITFSGHIPKI